MKTEAQSPSNKKGIVPFIKRRLGNWMLRHQLPFNFAIHMVGIPVAVAGIPMLFFFGVVLGCWGHIFGLLVAIHRSTS